MAFIPDEAVDRMTELSAGAWRLYCFLARCRNQKTGKCCPSINVTMETIGTKRRQTFELRKELAKAGWATFDGNTVIGLFGFDSAKNRTVNAEPAELTGESAENRTVEPESAVFCTPSAENRTTQCEKSHSTVQKIALAYKEEPAKEPANRTSKEIHVPSLVLEVFTYWQAAMNHPQAKLTPERKKKIEARLDQGYTVGQIKTAIDGCRASPFHMGTGSGSDGTVYDDLTLICRNGDKLEFFISRSNSNGRPQIPRNETHNERAAREMEELFRQSAAAYAPTDSDSGPDPADAGAPWLAADFRRV